MNEKDFYVVEFAAIHDQACTAFWHEETSPGEDFELVAGCGGGRIFEVVADEGDGVGGGFFHEPVAGVGDDGFADVDGDVAHDDSLGCAERFASAYCKDGHGEFGAGKDFV